MESKFDDKISGLRAKIKSIITLYEEHKFRNKILESKNKELAEQIHFLEKKLNETAEKSNNIKFAKAILASGENSHEAKIKVNRIVREIDKCIALLNK